MRMQSDAFCLCRLDCRFSFWCIHKTQEKGKDHKETVGFLTLSATHFALFILLRLDRKLLCPVFRPSSQVIDARFQTL